MSTLNRKRRVLFEFVGVDGYLEMEELLRRRGHAISDYVATTVVIDGDMKEIWIPKAKDQP